MKKLLKNRSGTAEIVGTVLFLVILFFFFSNVFLWHNQVTRQIDGMIAEKMNSAVRIEFMVISGNSISNDEPIPELGRPGPQGIAEAQTPNGYSLIVDYTFHTAIDTAEKKRLVADLRLSIDASYGDDLNEACFIYIWDCGQSVWMNTGLMVTNGYRWSNTTLSLPSSYIDPVGKVEIQIRDASSQLGFNDTEQGTLSIHSMEVYADSFALEVTNLGGSDATLSRLWIVNATQTGAQTDHIYADFKAVPNDTLVAGGASRTIRLSTETAPADGEESILATADGDSLVVHYVPPAGQTVIFRVLTTLGNTAACSYAFT